MKPEPISVVTGPATPLMRADVDTDTIITREFTITTGRGGLGRGFMHPWRIRPDGTEDPDFILNQDGFRAPTVLIAGPNFACGSSREHAVWAARDFGLKAIIAPSFGGHFFENACKNGLLPVVLEPKAVTALADWALAARGAKALSISLPDMAIAAEDGPRFDFAMDAGRRESLMEGLDEIGQTLKHAAEIAAFQAADRARRPWVWATAS